MYHTIHYIRYKGEIGTMRFRKCEKTEPFKLWKKFVYEIKKAKGIARVIVLILFYFGNFFFSIMKFEYFIP